MKSAFIISSYPTNQKKIDLLKTSIKSVKNKGFDVIALIEDDDMYSEEDDLRSEEIKRIKPDIRRMMSNL